MSRRIRQQIKRTLRKILPLGVRKGLCIFVNRQQWLREEVRSWWTNELLRDFQERDINSYHKFLWTNHLAYALPYEASVRFGRENMVESRRIFFSDLSNHLKAMGVDPAQDIRSVLEVGCSLGYQLRHLETDLVTSATELIGIDIDAHAISEGRRFLKKVGSKVDLICGEMTELDRLLGEKSFDLVLSTGVLMYLEEKEATEVVGSILRRCRLLAALSGPANVEIDNCNLSSSVPRGQDGSLIHNIDAMVQHTNGEVLGRRWEGGRVVEGQTLYFVFAKGDTWPHGER